MEEEIPLSVKNMLPRTKNLISPESWDKGLSFKPTAADILLTTGLKTGTTWVEQVMPLKADPPLILCLRFCMAFDHVEIWILKRSVLQFLA